MPTPTLTDLTPHRSPRRPHLTRYAMYRHLAEVLEPFSASPGHVLSVSHSLELPCLAPGLIGQVTEANYPECSLLELPFPDGSFDYVFSDQVLEHVEGNPERAVEESRRVLRPGGIAVHTTCFIQPVHVGPETPSDLWRFTPQALRWLCRNFSQVVDAGGWGNLYAWLAIGLGLRYRPVPTSAWHPLNIVATRNHASWPIVTWVVARK